jgi:predicted nuclease of predicted toxin-antitoxin system
MSEVGGEKLRFIADENVPQGLVSFLLERGHEVIISREIIGQRATDDLVAAFTDQSRAILITFNGKDFKRIAARRPPPHSNRRSLRNYSAVYFDCGYVKSVPRLREHIDIVEWEARKAGDRPDKRIFITIGGGHVKIER